MNEDIKHDAGSQDREHEREHDVIGSYDPAGQASSTSLAPIASAPPTPPPDDVIDVHAAAQLLHVGRNTVYALVARNAIPHRRLGKQIRFHRAAIVRWLDSWSSQGAKEGH